MQINGANFSAKDIFDDIRNYLAGRFVGATRDEFLLNEVIKLILCKHDLKKKAVRATDLINLSKEYRAIFKKINEKYDGLFSSSEEIELDPISISYVDEKLNQIDLLNIERDPIGDAYEIFIGDSIKGQSGQFFTPKNVAQALVEMVNPKPGDKVLDLACGAGGFLVSILLHYKKSGYNNDEIENSIQDCILGVDKDDYLTRLAKIHFACLVGSIPQIKCADSIEWDNEILGDSEEKYDFIVTNPPFGSNIISGSNETLNKYQLAYKWKSTKNNKSIKTEVLNEKVPPQVVFIERCIRLVKKGGKIGIVVPESLISSKKYSYVVEYIRDNCIIEAVIGMPEELFKTSGKGGTHTKTSLLVLTKKHEIINQNNIIFMAEANWCGHDSRGREIPNNDIPSIITNFNNLLKGKEIEKTKYLSYLMESQKIEDNILVPKYYMGHNDTETFEGLDKTHDIIKMRKLIEDGIIKIETGHEVGKLSYGTGDIPFVRTSDISNWEIKSDPKHNLCEDIYLTYKDRQNIEEGDILMVKDGTYLIGTCAMITKYDIKMVYQSHLYKMRINTDDVYNLNPYLFLAILSSEFVQNQIKAKVYSQDIINSLGDRVKDLLIPIPKDPEKKEYITEIVQKSIDERIEAREHARLARIEVLK